jgi:hypothetical protein
MRVLSRSTSATISSAGHPSSPKPGWTGARGSTAGIAQAIEPLAEQPHQRRRIARGPPGLDRQPAHHPVAAEEARGEAAAAQMLCFEIDCGFFDQLAQRGERILDPRDRLGEAPRHDQRGWRAAWRDTPILLAEQPREPGGQIAEARGEGSARPGCEVADRLQPGAAKRGRRFGIRLECGDGERKHIFLGMEASKRPSRIRRVPHRHSRRHPAPFEPTAKLPRQPRLAAEQMYAAADVEDEPIRRLDHHHRRIAVAAIGDPF